MFGGLFGKKSEPFKLKTTDQLYFDQYLKVASGGNIHYTIALEVPDRIQFKCTNCGSVFTTQLNLDNPTQLPHDAQEFIKFHRHAGNFKTAAEVTSENAKAKLAADQKILDAQIEKYKAEYEEKKKHLEDIVQKVASPIYVKKSDGIGPIIQSVPGKFFTVGDDTDYVAMGNITQADTKLTAAQHAALQQQVLAAQLKLQMLKTQLNDIPKIEYHEPPKPQPKAPKTPEGRRFR